MITISLTDFIEFITRSGPPKLTEVRRLKSRGDYHPVKDYWGPLRDHIVDYHKVGEGDKRFLDTIVQTFDKDTKQANCRALVGNYKQFLGKKAIESLPPPRAKWSYKTLTVRINPELYLVMNGTRHIIKLYFKGAPLSKSKTELIHLLMITTLAGKEKTDEPINYTLLDLPHSRVYSALVAKQQLLPLLAGEAEAFIAMWDRLD